MKLCVSLAFYFWAFSVVAATGAAQGTARLPPLPELERQAAADSNDPLIHVQLGRALLEKGRHDEAERRFRHAARLAPGLAEVYLGLAAVPNARGENYWKRREKQDGREAVVAVWSEAAKFSRLAFLLDPLVDPGLIPRVEERVTIRVDGVNYRVWWILPLAKAINAFRSAKYEEAKRRIDKLLKEPSAGPDGAGLPDDVLWFRALAAAHLDDYHGAATDFTLIMTRATQVAEYAPVEITPLLANDYRYMAATMLYYAGQVDVATLLFREALGNDPSLYMAHTQLARIHESAGRWGEAVTERQRAVDANPENGDLMVDLGLTLLRAGEPEPAFAAFDQATGVNPSDPKAPYHKAMTALRLEQHEVARGSFERFLTIAPSRMRSEVAQARGHLEALKR